MQQDKGRIYERNAGMNITDVRVRKVTKEGKMKAVVSITIDEEFVVHDIKVIDFQNKEAVTEFFGKAA